MPTVRPATADDLDAIAAVEASSFVVPWTRDVFAAELGREIARLVVITQNEQGADGRPRMMVVGFACTWFVADEAHLLRIAVLPAHQRCGLGQILLTQVLTDARAARCVHVDLEVGRANVAAAALYAHAGFVEVGVRRGYYQHPPDDAVLLRAVLASPDAA